MGILKSVQIPNTMGVRVEGLGEINIGFDKTADVSFLSHAHKDHVNAVASGSTVIATKETIALSNKRFVEERRKNVLDKVKMYNSGHMLGSAQICVDVDGSRVLYTGDLRVRDSILFKGAEIPEADVLIMDGTYNSKEYIFPDYEDVIEDMVKWIKGNENKIRIMCGYAIGKSQEIIKIVNEYVGDIPVVDKTISRYADTYKRFGIDLEYVVAGSEEGEEVMRDAFIGIVPMRRNIWEFANALAHAFKMPVTTSVSTGWALKYKYNVDKAFPLSDHSDYEEINEFIDATGAKEVYFFCGPRA